MRSEFDAYLNRPEFFAQTGSEMWSSWLWQQQNAIRNAGGLAKVFPRFLHDQLESAREWERRGFRFLLTPYVLALVEKDAQGNPLVNDPIWRQIFPLSRGEANDVENDDGAGGDAVHDDVARNPLGPDEYSANQENWEIAGEMISPIAQHKYDNRVIIYVADNCLGYCNYCFRSLQSNAESEKHGGRPHWRTTLEVLRVRTRVEEVILSGGDPLVFDNFGIENMLQDLREIPHIRAIRIHTRAWLHNPFRIDEDFCRLLKKYQVTEMGVHIVHPREMTVDFQDAVARVRASGARTQLMTDTPLIKGVNDSPEILHELFMGLYLSGIKPYYLSHNMPNIPAAGQQRTSVRRGLEIYNSLKRRISNVAMPEYIICHKSGKRTVPETPQGTADFIYDFDANDWPIIRFKNWKGEWEVYVDGK